MPFPRTQRVIFERNPLAEVVCELRFPPILRIASELPADFQGRIRGMYPIFQQPAFTGPIGIPNQPGLTFVPGIQIGWPQHQQSFVFANEDQTQTLTLTQESFSIAERNYREWGQLRENVAMLKEHLEAVYTPPFYTRLGLRYVDLIDRDALGLDAVAWGQLLNPAFAGLLASEPVAPDVLHVTSVTELTVPDVSNGRVRIQHGLIQRPGQDRLEYAIDSDFSVSERSDLADILPTLDIFSARAGDLFRWAISERLHAALQPAPVSGHHAA
jgi:uncharacterized protein (TIGR04255 family)